MKKISGLLLAFMVITLLSGCSGTVKGVGKDLENMGEWVQNKA